MNRPVVEVPDLASLPATPEPVRLVFLSPERGGPRITDIRAALASRGRLRLSGSPVFTHADLDPGEIEQPVVALDTIVRSDAAGLRRMIYSALPHVDEIVLGVDGRSDEETKRVALAYADRVHVFEGADLGMSREDWDADKINFAAARNLGRQLVISPWALVVDSDEYVRCGVDLRASLRQAPETQHAFLVVTATYQAEEALFAARDFQRLARTKFRWISNSHNQLVCDGLASTEINVEIVQDTAIRSDAENARRTAQRNAGIEALVEEAKLGNLNALFHVAKHAVGACDLTEAVKLVEDFRLRVEPNSINAFQRQWLAVGLAVEFYKRGNFPEANRWCCRVLLDGPSVAAFCVLGEIAEAELDLERALNWFEAACAVGDLRGLSWPGVTELRYGRLMGLRMALANPDRRAEAVRFLSGALDSPPDVASSTDPSTKT